jgi:hypothetical protein
MAIKTGVNVTKSIIGFNASGKDAVRSRVVDTRAKVGDFGKCPLNDD